MKIQNICCPPHDYPHNTHSIKFLTQIYQPNVNSKDDVCKDLFQANWSTEKTIKFILQNVLEIMKSLDANNVLEASIGTEMRDTTEIFREKSKKHTRRFAH
jgi:ubiquitin-protein ligase